MWFRKTGVMVLVGSAALCGQQSGMAQDVDAGKERTMKVGGAAGQPVFVLQLSAEGRWGKVQVRDEQGAEAQSLTCALLRDTVAPQGPELEAVREQFVEQFEARDLNFDGNADLMGVREFGANWGRYCVWLYDPGQKNFARNFLAEQMELLSNLTATKDHRIATSSLGPTNPWHAVYRIAGAEGSRPPSQLVPVYSCVVETTADGERPTSIVSTRFEDGQTIVERRETGQMALKAALGRCNSPKRTGKNPRAQPR
jgi:hypothetical protein